MEVRVRRSEQHPDIHIMEIEGRIDANTAPKIETELQALKEQNAAKIIVDFSQVNYISSGGLRVFLTALKWTRAGNGDLKLVNLVQNVEKIFKLAGFTKIFNIMPDVESAEQAF
ncbi:anti-sigma factor antagonist [candidate division KSB3 bacterium]|uniref:Anti-sigma factor antagonist n=1 Tax=candidate division KSB3 bacterium TaxID=2044937 RepID=A0A9D5JYG5_9BACT|nr:anti-sigma factor antagonist [candidate division KSB3 bacterium]MBD3326539.1 anti-sigma factor antagonist [candidate division KSB3 bacterium]